MDIPLICVVIPNWNIKADLGECLDSLRASNLSNLRVIVVDNGSTPETRAYVTANYPWVQQVNLPENRGYAGGLNAGIRCALRQGADYVLAMNNDVAVAPDMISKLLALMIARPEIGIAAPKALYNSNPNIIFSVGDRIYPWLPLPVGIGYRKRNGLKYSGVMDLDYVTGCAMLIRRSVFERIGLFNTQYFMYYEDADFCRRAHDAGLAISCHGGATLRHKASLSSRADRAASLERRSRNRMLFFRRYRHGPATWLTWLALALGSVIKVASLIAKGQRRLVGPYLRGFFSGWRSPLEPPQGIEIEDPE